MATAIKDRDRDRSLALAPAISQSRPEGLCCYLIAWESSDEKSDDKRARSATYVGVTNNFSRRLRQHNAEIQGGARATTSRVGGGKKSRPIRKKAKAKKAGKKAEKKEKKEQEREEGEQAEQKQQENGWRLAAWVSGFRSRSEALSFEKYAHNTRRYKMLKRHRWSPVAGELNRDRDHTLSTNFSSERTRRLLRERHRQLMTVLTCPALPSSFAHCSLSWATKEAHV
jgi:predicted GIY-YIG superfamily endonuclease